MSAHVSILSSVSRTTLTQIFTTASLTEALKEVKYAFPIYDGVSVVAFTCTIGDRVVRGVVKEKQKAREVYEQARDRGEAAALLEQTPEAADVWTTSVGNIPPNTEVKVEIVYLGELKHDAEVDGIRYTIPTSIAPRYGELPAAMLSTNTQFGGKGGLQIVVDAQVPNGSVIKAVQSPSHPISVAVGNLSTTPKAEPSLQKASATLALGSAEFDKDFILHVIATNTSNPVAMVERHPTLPNERALMATLVPKFKLPPERPEIVFVCDRSGSMGWGKIANLKTALQIFLKSLPVGVKFNICSFGSSYSLLWDRSKSYDKASLEEATRHVDTFQSNMGGTEMCQPIKAVFEKRYKDMNLEVFLLTDGDIWDQANLFSIINAEMAQSNGAVRVFTLGIGTGASTSLVEGAARCGNGFSQLVGDNEKMNNKVVRMLKGALTPHIKDYTLEIKYDEQPDDADDFELVEKVVDCLIVDDGRSEKTAVEESAAASQKKPISLFDASADDEDSEMTDAPSTTAAVETKYNHLPPVTPPKLLQAPFQIPPLFPFNRTSVYVLMSGETIQRPVKSVVLRGTSVHGPLELEIPVTTIGEPSETLHQLAARKAVKELEEGKGWLYHAKDADQKLLKDKYDGRFSDMVEREAVRLGVKYQVAGKWCSFVAVEEKPGDDGKTRQLTQPDANLATLDSDGELDHVSFGAAPSGRHSSAPGVQARIGGMLRHRKRSGGGGAESALQQQQRTARLAQSYQPPPPPPPAPAPASSYVSSIAARGYDMPELREKSDAMSLQAASFRKSKKSSFSATVSELFGSRSKESQTAPSDGGAPASEASLLSFAADQEMSFAYAAPLPDEDDDTFEGAAAPKPPTSTGLLKSPASGPAAPGSVFGASPQPASVGGFGAFGQADNKASAYPSAGLFGARASPTGALQAMPTGGPIFGGSFAAAAAPAPRTLLQSAPAPKPLSQSYQAPAAKPAPAPKRDPLEVIVDTQTFEGFWPASSAADLLAALGVTKGKLDAALAANKEAWVGKLRASDDAVLTALVLVFLEKKLGHDKDTWEMMAEKAWDWLRGVVGEVEEEDVEGVLGALF